MKITPRDQDYDYQRMTSSPQNRGFSTDRHGYPSYCDANFVGVCLITPPTSFVVVAAGDWPGSLILLLALNLPIQGAFFPVRFHAYFKSSKYQVTSWKPVADFHGPGNDTTPIYLLSGGVPFLKRVLSLLVGCQRVIVTLDVTRQGASRTTL
jgi:hypothetical protein